MDDRPPSNPPTARVRYTDMRDPFKGAPWWVGTIFKAVGLLGVPVVFLGFYAWRDYKLLDRMTSTLERNAVFQERLAPVLERMERRLSDDKDRRDQ